MREIWLIFSQKYGRINEATPSKWKNEYKDYGAAEEASTQQPAQPTPGEDAAAASLPPTEVQPSPPAKADADESKEDEEKKRKRHEGETPEERAERKRRKKEKKEKKERRRSKKEKEESDDSE